MLSVDDVPEYSQAKWKYQIKTAHGVWSDLQKQAHQTYLLA